MIPKATTIIPFKSLSSFTARTVMAQSRRYQTVWSHSSTDTVKTSADVNSDQKPFNVEISQADLDEMKKTFDSLEQKDGKDFKEYVMKNAKGFKDLKDKGARTAEEQERPEDYM